MLVTIAAYERGGRLREAAQAAAHAQFGAPFIINIKIINFDVARIVFVHFFFLS